LLAARQQRVQVPALGNAAPVSACGGELVAVDHRHLSVGVGEHAGGQQSRHAGAEHDCVVADAAG
jgi:hypothetical protein